MEVSEMLKETDTLNDAVQMSLTNFIEAKEALESTRTQLDDHIMQMSAALDLVNEALGEVEAPAPKPKKTAASKPKTGRVGRPPKPKTDEVKSEAPAEPKAPRPHPPVAKPSPAPTPASVRPQSEDARPNDDFDEIVF